MTNGFTRERKIERWGETEEKLFSNGLSRLAQGLPK